MFCDLFVCFLLALVEIRVNSKDVGSNWAVLVAGSSGYINYRHQADIAHAYQILTEIGGFPPSNIITMMFNDVVSSAENPFPGMLFNEPGGDNVYHGINIDYESENVTAVNFLNVLKGIQIDPRFPVLKSNKNDKVFIYYSDHGTVGLVAMPVGPPVYASDLINALQYMYDNRMYNELVFYIEACESGSMFDNILPTDISVFATTAANTNESSYAFYYNSTLKTYMADEFSIRWMQDCTSAAAVENSSDVQMEESLLRQFENVKAVVNLSHVMQYGDKKFEYEPITDFEGFEEQAKKKSHQQRQNISQSAFEVDEEEVQQYSSSLDLNQAVDSRDVALALLQQRYLSSQTLDDKEMYTELISNEIERREKIDLFFHDLIVFVSADNNMMVESFVNGDIYREFVGRINFDCLKKVYPFYVSRRCSGVWDAYSLKYVRSLVNLCAMYTKDDIKQGFENVCRK